MENKFCPVTNTWKDRNQKAGDLEDVKAGVPGCLPCHNHKICLLADMPMC